MSNDRVFTKEEFGGTFRSLEEGTAATQRKSAPEDWRWPRLMANRDLCTLRGVYEDFSRILSSSLSTQLHSYVQVDLWCVEELSFCEFCQCLPSESCIVWLKMGPLESISLLAINPLGELPILDLLLGRTGKPASRINGEVTEIEQIILEGILRSILKDLKTTWAPVMPIDFSVDTLETEPCMSEMLVPAELVVAIEIHASIGDNVVVMSMGIPSIAVTQATRSRKWKKRS